MENDWKYVNKDSDLNVMMEKAATSRFVSKICAVLGVGTTFAYSMRMLYALYVSVNTPEDPMPMFFTGKFPYNTKISPNFEITWLLQFIATLMSSIAFSAVDSLFVILILHLCGQMTNLQNDFKIFGKKKYINDSETDMYIIKLVRKHNRINK